MKRLAIPTAAAALAVASMAMAPRTVEHPEFSAGTMTFSIESVEVSDTATRVNTSIYGRPGYWIACDTNIVLLGSDMKRTYKLKAVEGITFPGKTTLPPESYVEATFVFPPLAEEDSVVSFIENGGSWYCTGIDLSGRHKGFPTHISGTVEGRPDASWLILVKAGDDARVNKKYLVPVRDGKFDYTVYSTDTIAFDLSLGIERLNGSWRNANFFSEGTPITVSFPQDNMPAKVTGSPLTDIINERLNHQIEIIETLRFNERMDSLRQAEKYYTPRVNELYTVLQDKDTPQDSRQKIYAEFDSLKRAGVYLTPEGAAIEEEYGRISNAYRQSELEFIKSEPTLAGLYYAYIDMVYDSPEVDSLIPVLREQYAKKYPEHPYMKKLQTRLGQEAPLPGYKVPDFTAPDLNGEMHNLADLIRGKVALVDLWASWCGPCRRASMGMIPVYEKWKDKGFTIVGVARENVDTSDMELALKNDGYPWINLVELNDRAGIWNLYRAANGGGTQVLVDADGIVLAVEPTAEQVDAILAEKLK
ncbi:MAG: AhpC/TSA family protein [Muribaculaceae bacterium]|nr:AhpC/TSA family protein [Muribaculaceae bacterium]